MTKLAASGRRTSGRLSCAHASRGTSAPPTKNGQNDRTFWWLTPRSAKRAPWASSSEISMGTRVRSIVGNEARQMISASRNHVTTCCGGLNNSIGSFWTPKPASVKATTFIAK